MRLIKIENTGKKIKKTNYWKSEYATEGKLYFSINAGCIRMLVPEKMEHIIPEIKTGKKIILSRGAWPEQGRDDSFEILFDDYSDNPFVLHVGTEQWDMIPKKEKGWEFAVWTRERNVLQKKCYYRKVSKIPYMKPWGE